METRKIKTAEEIQADVQKKIADSKKGFTGKTFRERVLARREEHRKRMDERKKQREQRLLEIKGKRVKRSEK